MDMVWKLDSEEDRQLEQLAQIKGLSKNVTVRQLVNEAWKREQEKQIHWESLDEIASSRAKLLERFMQ